MLALPSGTVTFLFTDVEGSAATAATLRRIIGAMPPPAWHADLERSLEAASRGLGGDTIEEASARGRAMTLADAIAFALEEPPMDRPPLPRA